MTDLVELRPGTLAEAPDGLAGYGLAHVMLPGNTAAIRLYQRYGFRPTWSYLSRFTGR